MQLQQEPSLAQPQSAETPDSRAQQLYTAQKQDVYVRTDRLFAILMSIQWLVGVAFAFFVSPRSWTGLESQTHIHVWAAIFLGGVITCFPVWMALVQPGKRATRHMIAVGQMLMSALLIHLSGGRIETHFHVFGSLAFLAFYRDWYVLITASTIVAADHGLRGLLWPQSVYGVSGIEPWRWVEHTGWVLFEDVFLTISIKQSQKEMWDGACRQADVEQTNQIIEAKVAERTAQLAMEIEYRKETETALADRAKELDENLIELGQLSKDLEQSRDQAVRASRFKSEFLANMSHEIRTPLNAVVGMSDLLMRTPLSDEQREYCMIVNNSADALLGLINDILDYSKIEAGKLELEIIEFDIAELLEGAAELVAERARAKQLSLITYVDPGMPRLVRGDPARIRQVLLNFLSNSIKFTHAGEIVIRAEQGATDSTNRIQVNFSVADTGIGINEASRERLFHPFTQADASTTRKYGGTGLGLVICKRIVEAMAGTIHFESVDGEGSTFGFAIELEPCGKHQGSVISVPERTRQTRVLIVGGPPGAQQILQSYLTAWGLRTSSTTDITKGALMLRQEEKIGDPYALAIVVSHASSEDLLLSAPSELIVSEGNVRTRLMVMGATATRDFGRRALKEGYSAYLPLPVRQLRLFDCIVSVLEKPAELDTPSPKETQTKEIACDPDVSNLVLVVEDNRVNQKVALLQLRELGFLAHTASNGVEALEAVSRCDYAVILMDCQMPEMDGFQATSEIRKLEALTGKHSPIIAMTAHAMSGDRLRCLAAGMDDYLTKPVSQAELAAVLRRWLVKPAETPAGSV
jgi:two-component system, sensor histidine kinase and response regulator